MKSTRFRILAKLFWFSTALAVSVIGTGILGCGDPETPLDPAALTEHTAPGLLAETKHSHAVPAAPANPQNLPPGTPTVTEIGYYRDWKRSKPSPATVAAGETIHIKIVFSEDMSLVVADDKTARPVLYYRINGTLTRFKVAGFGATGDTFASGDAKPVKTQSVFFAKYTVKPTDTGSFTVAVGKKSTDRQGTALPAFYTHPTHSQGGAPHVSYRHPDRYPCPTHQLSRN